MFFRLTNDIIITGRKVGAVFSENAPLQSSQHCTASCLVGHIYSAGTRMRIILDHICSLTDQSDRGSV